MFSDDLNLLMQDTCIMCGKTFGVFCGVDPLNLTAGRSDGSQFDVGLAICHGCPDIDESDLDSWIEIDVEDTSWIVISKNALVEGLFQGVDGYTVVVESIMLLHSDSTPIEVLDGQATMFIERVAAARNREEAERIMRTIESNDSQTVISNLNRFGPFNSN